MRLEKVILNGFKSFADKTEFRFDSKVTAIVGPNGCGKSNVVDGVKWVLGEQSAKSLRSGQMTDVIFSGSGSRKASGMSEVSLCFSQVANYADDQDELRITRRLYRSGESEYLINNKSCRLKDIRELFMDTGIGAKAYSIIEQGQVDQLVTSNKVDRRGLFEEAAGISKYKAHKKEALRKLDRTEQNLLRLADIVSEIQKQLRSIKLQAGKARNYLGYKEKLKELSVNYSLSEYHQMKTALGKKGEALAEVEACFGEVVSEVGRNDALFSELTSEIISTEGDINRSDNALISIKSKIEQQKQRIEYLQARIAELGERKEKATAQIESITQQNAGFEKQITDKQTELAESENAYEEKQKQIEDFSGNVHELSMECNSVEADLADEKSGIIDIVRRSAQLHNEISSLDSHRDNLAGQKDRLHGKVDTASAELKELLTEKAHYQARFGDIESVLTDLQSSLEDKREQMEQLNSDLAVTSDKLSTQKQQRSAMQSELKVLDDMESNREGLDNAVKNVLSHASENNIDYIDGIVADVVQADSAYAGAVEVALADMADAVVVNSTAGLLGDSATREMLQGRINFVCSDKISPFVDKVDLSARSAVRGRLVEFVDFDSKHTALVWQLLGKTILVDNVNCAIEISSTLDESYRFVTTDGVLLSGGNIITDGPMGAASGLISRRSRINELTENLDELGGQIDATANQFEKYNQDSQHLAKLCQELRTSIYEANTEKTEANSKLASLGQNIERLTNEQPLILGEIEMLEEQIASGVQKQYESQQHLDELETVKQERDAHIEELEAKLSEAKMSLEERNAMLTELKVAMGQIVEQRKARRGEIASLQSQVQHARMALESARTELLASDGQVEQSTNDISESEQSISDMLMEKEKAQEKSNELHAKVEQMMAEKLESEQTLRAKRSEQAQLEEQIHELKIQISQVEVRRDDLCVNVKNDLDMDIVEAYEGYEHGDIDWDQVRDEIVELKQKIDRLGNVNVDAIDEQVALEERNEFLSKQVEDLNQSKSQLEQLINKINRESKEKFRVTFEQIRENFQVLFRKLFGGGKADVILENPDDILESGIEIIARPPGKETRSISLLSGGEKTMTAIGLLFAVFKSKPSPFCILDEVDAALDEANNERFNLIIEEFKDLSQFVIVTHSKRTMSIADVLFGVTMQTQGVSKKIGVQFGDDQDESAA